ncbi:MFS transporter [Arthrobacter sp. ISL-28]|uniref:MFS transporter n=1 Tax=Arthrobacter sp. ISL-28 TaxID=2819108 RepID=UPI001BE58DF8|nr:glycoside-pentoside-hexuronide (GPH):cation symporter [Arthrobacter sp. ISL-28]MBT2523617.1 MFS transporter [Arthrobacter sp. ISL-28]
MSESVGTAAAPVSIQSTTRPFGWRDKIGYLFGDLGNDFTFLLASSYLLVFYTNVAGLQPAHVGVLFLAARLVDAFTDVGWGRFLDRHRPSRAGRFRAWIGRAALPLVVVSALLYAPFIADWDYGLKLAYAAVTYLLWGSVFYTMVNIAYGSLASVMSPNPGERASLSVFRAFGANVAGLFVALVPPLLIYATVDGVSQVIPSSFFITGIMFSIAALVFYAVCYTQVRERVQAVPVQDKRSFLALLRSLAGNRALLGLMAGNLVLMLASLLTMSMAAYLWLNYFNNGALSGPAQLANYLPALLLAPIAAWLARRFGKKEVIVAGIFFSAAVYVVLAVTHVTSPWAFIVITVLAGFGMGTYTLLVWALIGDVIDHEEVRSGERDDGTVYAVNTWARKVGLALAGGLAGFALSAVGFQPGSATQTQETIDGIYLVSTLVPGILYAVAALLLLFIYPLDRKRVAANVAELKSRRGHGE